MASDPRETTDVSAQNPEIFERLKAALIKYDNDVLTEGPDWWERENACQRKVPEPM